MSSPRQCDPNIYLAQLPLVMDALLRIDYPGAEGVYAQMAQAGVQGVSFADLAIKGHATLTTGGCVGQSLRLPSETPGRTRGA